MGLDFPTCRLALGDPAGREEAFGTDLHRMRGWRQARAKWEGMLVEESDGRIVRSAVRVTVRGRQPSRPAKTVGTRQDGEMSKGAEVDSSMKAVLRETL